MEIQKISGKTRGLGRGIGALIPGAQSGNISSDKTTSTREDRTFFNCEVERIIPNKFQPREIFDATALSELSKSIKENGVIQPLIVRRSGEHFELIAGERRLQASMLAGLKKVPVVIKDVTDRQTLEMAIIENIQRDELSCLEEAKAYRQLVSDFKMTQEQVAIKVGKDRVTVANTIRLLLLPKVIQTDLLEKKLSMGHARALLALTSEKKQIEIRDRILSEGLTVRQVEKIIQNIKKGITEKKVKTKGKGDFMYIIEELKKSLQTKIDVKGKKSRGKIIIHYSTEEELDRIFNDLTN